MDHSLDLGRLASQMFAASMPAQPDPAPQPEASAAHEATSGLMMNASTGAEEPPSMAQQMFGPKDAPDVSAWIERAPAELEQARREASGMFDRTAPFGGVEVGDLIEGLQPGLPPEAVAAAQTEVHHWLADAGLTPGEAGEVVTLARQLAANPPDDAAVAQMQAASWKLLRETYGDHAETALLRAQALVQRDPRLVRTLEQTRLGDHPKVVLKLAQQAYREAVRGRLKV